RQPAGGVAALMPLPRPGDRDILAVERRGRRCRLGRQIEGVEQALAVARIAAARAAAIVAQPEEGKAGLATRLPGDGQGRVVRLNPLDHGITLSFGRWWGRREA